MKKISPEEIKILSKYIKDVSGIHLDESKAYLLETRLNNILEKSGCESHGELCDKAKQDGTKAIEKSIVDAITTNETLFFRDASPFELLQHKILPDLIDSRSSPSNGSGPVPLRIWSAACSTGQEVYTILMVLKEFLGSDLA